MTPRQAVEAIYVGNRVQCSALEWPVIRDALHDAAGKWIDGHQDIRAQMALEEIRRIDKLLAACDEAGNAPTP